MSSQEDRREKVSPSWKDLLAVVIASLQTTLLPFVVVIVLLLVLSYLVISLASYR